MTRTCSISNLARGAGIATASLLHFMLLFAWSTVTVISVVGAAYLGLSHLVGLPSPDLNVLQASLLAAGLVASGLSYRRIAVNIGRPNALSYFGLMVALPGAVVYAQWLYRHCPAGFEKSVGTFFWPTAVPLATRLGLLPLQLVVCAAVSLVAFAIVVIAADVLSDLCRLGENASDRSS